MSENKVNDKPSPKLKLGLIALRKRKIPTITCPYCPAYLNAKHNHTPEHVESIDDTKVRKLECCRCNKTSWKCESCISDHTCYDREGAIRHTRRHHQIISNGKQNDAATKEVIIDDLSMDEIENEGYFGGLGNEVNYVSFTNNLRTIHPSQENFTKAIHEGNVEFF